MTTHDEAREVAQRLVEAQEAWCDEVREAWGLGPRVIEQERRDATTGDVEALLAQIYTDAEKVEVECGADQDASQYARYIQGYVNRLRAVLRGQSPAPDAEARLNKVLREEALNVVSAYQYAPTDHEYVGHRIKAMHKTLQLLEGASGQSPEGGARTDDFKLDLSVRLANLRFHVQRILTVYENGRQAEAHQICYDAVDSLSRLISRLAAPTTEGGEDG